MHASLWYWALFYLMAPLVMIGIFRAYRYLRYRQNESPFGGEKPLFAIGSALLLLLLWPLLLPAVLLEEKFKLLDRINAFRSAPWKFKKEHLTGLVSVEDAEARAKILDPLHRAPEVPFGHLNGEWKSFLAQKRLGYKLHGFAVPAESPGQENPMLALRGYAWTRFGRVKAEFIFEWGA